MAAEKAAAQKSAKPAEAMVTVKVAAAISGTRNGELWPAVGEPLTLPEAEAESYIQFGYVVPIEG